MKQQLPAAASSEPTGTDIEILQLFGDWERHIAAANAPCADDAVTNAATDLAVEIEETIAKIEPAGQIGIVIKLFLIAVNRFGMTRDDEIDALGVEIDYLDTWQLSHLLLQLAPAVPALWPRLAPMRRALEWDISTEAAE